MDSGASSSNLVPPETLKHGPQWFRDWGNSMRDYMMRTTPLAGPNILVNQAPNGIMITGSPPPNQNITYTPFELVVISSTMVRVVYGTVSSVIPDGMSFGDVPQYILTLGGSGQIYLVVTTDADGDITDVSIGTGTMPSDSVGTYYHEIGSYDNTSGTMSVGQTLSGSLDFLLCGGVTPEWGAV